MNPFIEAAKVKKSGYADWDSLAPKSYDKKGASPYTKARIILMNGTEYEANWFSHHFSRHCLNNDVRRILAEMRRDEQQQQKRLAALKPIDENILETTIGYEQLAVDLTAALAEKEANPFVKEQLDFALLEDFDHLYRYANLLDMEDGVKAIKLVGNYTEIMPGRPTISEHRHPNDDVRYYINNWQDDLNTRLTVGIITAAEQQTMNYYMNTGSFYHTDLGRKLYTEIAMIEEQHVTGYGSLMDPSATMFECLLMHEYTECYLYYSCLMDETDKDIKNIWEMHFNQELGHLKIAAELLEKYEGRDRVQVIENGTFPALLKLKSNKEYVRKVMQSVNLSALKEKTLPLEELKDSADFFKYQRQVNKNISSVASHNVINKYIKKYGSDYRGEDKPNPEKSLQDRTVDNISLGRKKENKK